LKPLTTEGSGLSAWLKLPRRVLGIVGAGERQGSGKPAKTGSTPAVVPGAAPALVKAGVGGFVLH